MATLLEQRPACTTGCTLTVDGQHCMDWAASADGAGLRGVCLTCGHMEIIAVEVD